MRNGFVALLVIAATAVIAPSAAADPVCESYRGTWDSHRPWVPVTGAHEQMPAHGVTVSVVAPKGSQNTAHAVQFARMLATDADAVEVRSAQRWAGSARVMACWASPAD